MPETENGYGQFGRFQVVRSGPGIPKMFIVVNEKAREGAGRNATDKTQFPSLADGNARLLKFSDVGFCFFSFSSSDLLIGPLLRRSPSLDCGEGETLPTDEFLTEVIHS